MSDKSVSFNLLSGNTKNESHKCKTNICTAITFRIVLKSI